MIKVHHLNNSRSQRILWLLEELGVPYEIVHYQRMSPVPFAPPELKAVHPLGKSPVITDGNHTIAELGAIIEYMLETYGKGRLRPDPKSDDHFNYIEWMHYAEGSAMLPLMMHLYCGMSGRGGRTAATPHRQRDRQSSRLHPARCRDTSSSSATPSAAPTSRSSSCSKRRGRADCSRIIRRWRLISHACRRVPPTSARSRRAGLTIFPATGGHIIKAPPPAPKNDHARQRAGPRPVSRTPRRQVRNAACCRRCIRICRAR